MAKETSERKRILVVDDDAQVGRLFKRILEEGGHTVLLAGSGGAALDRLQKETVNLLVLDLAMPDTDGFEVLKFVRERAPGLRVLVISGFLDGRLLEPAKFLGAHATLNKTDAPERLLETVNALLRW